ncbi:universal stress protein UspA and related nucleotide-binding proteins [Sulfuriferula multivorans]|uniref:Universal stress protein n=1 Tax=Sulfuriferula multivorans TaxID=1559896 RepID=A0A401K074_9PROT|nr:universal stress protein [Sulfuriferula multivorans]GCB02297.1 universal stress protein UspA and related nucleotide-binding proteins [Sulfuriferula multivorans]
MYERILVAVDGSSTSDKALEEAIKLALVHKATLRLVHVVDTAMMDVDNGGLVSVHEVWDALRQGGKTLLKKSEAHVQEADVSVDTVLLETLGVTRVATEIVKAAKEWPADLIVLGTHGRRGFVHLLLGSVAEDVVRMATTPVLLIRGE